MASGNTGAAKASSGNAVKYIHFTVVCLLMISGFFLPTIGPITKMGMELLGVFLGFLYGLIFCDIVWPSILAIVMMGLSSRYGSAQAGFDAALTSQSQIIPLFLYFAFISESKLLDIALNWFLTRKFTQGRPWVFISLLFFALALLATCFSLVVLVLLVFDILIKLFDRLGYTKEDAFPTYMLFGVGLFGGMGSLLLPFMPYAVVIKMLVATCMGGYALELWQWLLVVDLPMILIFILYIVLGRFVLKIDTTKLLEGSSVLSELVAEQSSKKFTFTQKWALGTLIVFFVVNISMAIWPNGPLTIVGLSGICLLLIVSILVVRKASGEAMMTIDTLGRGVNWGMLFMLLAILSLSNVLVAAGTGIVQAIAMVVVPLLRGVPPIVLVIALCIAVVLFSQVTMNMVLMMALGPIVTPIFIALGYNPISAIMAIVVAAQLAFLAPTGCMQAALVYSQVDWVKKPTMMKIALPWTILSVVVVIICTLFVPNIVYPM